MSCIDSWCLKADCKFLQSKNEVVKMCPLCGGPVINSFDEYPADYESPCGDDYDGMEDFED